MTPERWKRIEELFARASELDGAERAAYLARGCGDDRELRGEIEALIAELAGAGDALRDAITLAATAFTDDATARLVGRRLGPYRVLGIIGEGGMGTVYLAERDDAQYRRKVAIKVIQAGAASRELIARFRDERQLLAGLEHPGIVRLLDGGTTEDGTPYLVMEHVDGVPLSEHARSLPVRARLELLLRVADALQYAHQKLIVHRDVKPSNILVARDGAPKLLDFGIAKLLGGAPSDREALTRTGAAVFTIEYASPEQARGEPVSVASDVYSLGAVLYDVLTGQPPQRAGKNLAETLDIICEREPPPPSAIAPPPLRREVAGDVDKIVAKALRKRPDERYPSVAQLAEDLRRYLAGLPVTARDATFAYRARKFVARNRGKVAAAVTVALALAAATAISIVQARRADDAAARAAREARALLVERGAQELATGYPGRAMPYLAEGLRQGDDTPAVRFLIGDAVRPFEHEVARIPIAAGPSATAWSPDGAQLAIATMDGHLLVCDPSGRELARLPTRSPRLADVLYSPDGRTIAASGGDGRLYAWDALTRTPRFVADAHAIARDGGVFSGLAFTSDGRRVVTSGYDGVLAIRDAASGALVASVAVGDAGRVTALAVSPDGRELATGGADGRVRRWDAATAAPLDARAALPGAIRVLAYAPDGTLVSADGATIVAWRTDRAEPVTRIELQDDEIGDLTVAGDGDRVLVAGRRGTAKVWDVRTGGLRVELVHAAGVRSARWSRDGARIATAAGDGSYRVWDARTGALELSFEWASGGGDAPHSFSGARDIAFSPDGTRLLALAGAEVTIWRTEPAPVVAHAIADGGALAASWSPDERRIAAVGPRFAGVRELASGERLATFDTGGATGWDVAWRHDGARVAIAGDRGLLRVFTADGALVRALVGHEGRVNSVAWSRDGARVVSAGDDRTARIWDVATGTARITLAHPDHVMAAAWDPSGSRVATAGWDHHLRIWDAATGLLLRDLDAGPAQLLSLEWSPDGHAIAVGGHGGQAMVWDVAAGTRTCTLEGHTASVTDLAWTPDGALLATAGDDHTARVWDAATGKLLTIRAHPAPVFAVAWSHDGDRLMTADLDGGLRVWDVRRFRGSADELADFVARHAPFRLVGTRLERATSEAPARAAPAQRLPWGLSR